MPPGIEVVEGVEDEGEAREPVDAELGVFDVGVVGDDLDRGVELVGRFFGDLVVSAIARDDLTDRTHQSFRLLDVFLSEQELAVKIAEIDCVEVDHMDFAEAG